MMNTEITPEQRMGNFVATWASRPGFVMGSERNLLDRAQAFLSGIKWATAFDEPELESFRTFLELFDRKLSCYLTGSDDGVSWYEALLERNEGDQKRAFQDFIQMLSDLGKRDKVISTDANP